MPTTLTPATALAAESPIRFPNESAAYRAARTALLAEEIELRRHLERVAVLRRTLPPGGEVTGNYRFEGENGQVTFADLFGDKDTLVVYSFMYGPQRKRPCPVCVNLLGPLDTNAADIEQNVALAVIARSPIARLTAWKSERGWRHLKLYGDRVETYSRDYHGVAPDGSDVGQFNVFVREKGAIRHFWGDEMTPGSADPGEDPRGAPELAPLWNILDLTPRGRAPDWYPSLAYDT